MNFKKNFSFLFIISICISTLFGCNQNNKIEQTNEKIEYTLMNGHYIVGTDIPAGSCKITVTSGIGNIITSPEMDISTNNEVLGDLNQLLDFNGERGDNFIENYILEEGYVLHLYGAIIVLLEYNDIKLPATGRNFDEINTIELKSGHYEVGKDLEAGVYNIFSKEGNGYLYSSNAFIGGIDEMFGVYDGTYNYVNNAYNIHLNDGDILELTNISIKLVKELSN